MKEELEIEVEELEDKIAPINWICDLDGNQCHPA